MKRGYKKTMLPVDKIRKFLEPGPVRESGECVFMVSGKHLSFPEKFKPQNL